MASTLTIEDRGHVRLIGLNRPEKRNAFTFAMLGELAQAPLGVAATLASARQGQIDALAALGGLYPQVQSLFTSADSREAIAAFVERRPPRFEGR